MIRTADGRPPRTAKAAWLHRAAAAGLPVPPGVVLADGADPSSVALPPGPLAVRSAFDGEDGTTTSAAGRYTSLLDVPATPDAVAVAIEQVRASADAAVTRADVLLMAMVDARHAGVAVLEPAHLDDLVEVVDGLADGLVGGQVEGTAVLLPRRDAGLRVRDDAPGWQHRLALLLADVRRLVGPSPAAGWDVEWADDGRTCHLLQVRPLLQPTTRNELLTLANHAEILPDLPSDFMTSLIIERGDDLLAFYTDLDRRLPRDRDLIVERAGRPLLNHSLLRDVLRTWGLPTALLADSVGGVEPDPSPPSPARALRSAPALVRLGLRQLTAVGDARTRGSRLLQTAHRPAATVGDLVDVAGELYAGLVTGMFALAGAHALQVAILARAGVLDEVQRRLPTPAGDLVRDLRAGVDRTEVLRRHGHRGVYESDLARPRFAEAPGSLPDLPPRATGSAPATTAAGTALLPLWVSARRSLAAREGLRDAGMRAFAVARHRLLEAVQPLLADPDDLWLLTTDEARRLDDGWRPDGAFLDDRRERRAQRAAVHVPDPIGRTDPLVAPSTDPDAPLAGRTLVAGAAEGRAWVCTEPPSGPPPFDGPAILVARAVDGGWAGAFAAVEGVVLHLGGDLSHGALILRELGVPTLTGVVDVHRRLTDGEPVRLDATGGLLARTSAADPP